MTSSGRAPFNFLAGLTILSLLALISCAEVQLPPGGEPDKRAPRVDSTLPANGSTAVPSGNTIEIYFSERVQSSTGKQIYISPRPAADPKIKWHSDRLSITLAEPFAPNQTTVVSLGSGVTDLRNNRLDSSMTIAFSTGPTLDSGRVAGQILSGNSPQAGMLVGLWKEDRLTDSIPLDSLYPDYLTVTDAKGYFTFKFLPDLQYRLIAFIDKNKDERFGTKREAFAIPDRPIAVGGDILIDSLVMAVTTSDSSAIGIVSANFNLSGMARIRLSDIYSIEYLRTHLSDAVLTSLADSLQIYPASAMLESEDLLSSTVTLAYGRIPAGAYSLVLPLRADSSLVYDSLNVRDLPDTEPPTIIQHLPSDRAIFATDVSISLTFSEPLDTSKFGPETIQLVHSDSVLVATRNQWRDQLHLEIIPDTMLDGHTYTLRLSEFELVDLAGNPFGDSLTEFVIKTLNTDSLGLVSGTVAIRLREKITDPAVLVFREITNKYTDTVAVKGKEFSLNVPAGKYLLSGFIDSNRDGTRNSGSLHPFSLAETSAIHRDTISVRARFETTGIEMIFK